MWETGDEPFNLATVEPTAQFTARITTDAADVAGLHHLAGAYTTIDTMITETEQIIKITLTRWAAGDTDHVRRVTADAAGPWSVIRE